MRDSGHQAKSGRFEVDLIRHPEVTGPEPLKVGIVDLVAGAADEG